MPAASRHLAQGALGGASHARSSSALMKVAQLESKIMNRKKQMDLRNSELGQKPSDESFSSASSREHSARGNKYRKNYAPACENVTFGNAHHKEDESIQNPKENVTVKQQLGLDSDEEEMRELMESPLEFSGRNENRRVLISDSKQVGKSETTVSSRMPLPSHKEISLAKLSKAPSFHSKDSEKNIFLGVNSLTPSPTSRNLSVLNNVRSQSLSSSVKDNNVKITLPRTGNLKQSHISLGSDGSEIKSLDELFSKAAEAEDSTSRSSNDFRVNILSLDDFASDIPSETPELKQKWTDIQIVQKSNRDPPKDTFNMKNDQTSLKMTSAVTGMNDASEGNIERIVTEAEISEHLSEVSADFPRHRQDYIDHDDRTVFSEYSEDFEKSLSATDSESVSEMSEEHSKSCTYSGKDTSSSASSPLFTRDRHDQVHRVTVKETAVQTVDSPFTYCWSKTNNSAVLGPAVGNSYIDPVPIASHVISMDTVEALTAYSPSVLVLNDMLKQHLMLTQQFVENIHHLHLSLVASLENEQFHYHTLEEAKEYIKNHKSPSLTIEQALQEIEKAQEQKLL
uniref:Chromosome 19 open reading frame 44 n=1 Tax=Apteryx owenii TaxID=8824 RepID=A0A8B9Q1I3_APTOW